LLVGLCIETVQYMIPRRVPSVSDVIANTGGAVFGCYLLGFRQLWHARKTTDKHRPTLQQTDEGVKNTP
ncbi:hypothetical protein GF339_03090, partial [candidate division KSB3 bacterium]|nr:hypothetical protein [candidate division KSB3 bacterium]MBD3323541.1 hypothetical protein [candidate division KSB3 bacterium]